MGPRESEARPFVVGVQTDGCSKRLDGLWHASVGGFHDAERAMDFRAFRRCRQRLLQLVPGVRRPAVPKRLRRPPPVAAPQHALGITLMLCSTVGFAVMATCAKIAGREVGAGVITVCRSLLTLGALYPYMRWKRLPLVGKDNPYLHARCLFGTVSMLLYYYGLSGAPLADCVVLANTAVHF